MKYLVLKTQPHWKKGEIVEMNEVASKEALKIGAVEPYQGTEPAKHAWIMVEPNMITNLINQFG